MTNLPKTSPDVRPRSAQPLSELKHCARDKFTGRVDLCLRTGWSCSLYFNLGNIVWASGGVHPMRRWRRLMNRHSPQALAHTPSVREADNFECWDYHILTVLMQRQRVPQDKIFSIVEDSIGEVLFDFVQALAAQVKANPSTKGEPYRVKRCVGLRPSETTATLLRQKWTLSVEPTLVRVRESWKQWTQAGLAACLPDLGAAIVQPERLEQQVSAKTYQHLKRLMDGKNSLRDLAVLTQRDTLGVARSLLPYLRHKSIKLVEIPDLKIRKNPPPAPPAPAPSRGTIACIDDSQRVCDTLQGIVTAAGYDCLAVCNPLEALPLLIQRKPDLIFLDLIMPAVNGYELCRQIRRLSDFQATPVIILTGNDGIVDRVRAKLVGATDFMSKPVEAKKVLAAASRHLEQKAV